MSGTNSVEKSGSIGKTILVVGAIGLLAAPFIKAFMCRRTTQQEFDKADAKVDKSLKETFPASDPPAQHFTDIPVNRRQ